MASKFKCIGEVIVGSGGSANMTFNSIPQTYTDLKLIISARGTRSDTADDYYMTFNNSSTGFSYRQLYGYSGGAGSASGSSGFAGIIPASTGTANTFGIQEICIANYTSSNYKSFSVNSTAEINSTTNWQMDLLAQLWSNTSAISSISFYSYNGSFAQYSTAQLYGISKS